MYARTTTHMTPEGMDRLGLREIDRIQAEMTTIAKKQGSPIWPPSMPSSKRIPSTFRHLRNGYSRISAAIWPDGAKASRARRLASEVAGHVKAIRLVHRPPRLAAYRHTGRKTPWPRGRSHFRFAERSLVDDEAIAYHEGIPGRHMQLSVQQQLSGMPKFPFA